MTNSIITFLLFLLCSAVSVLFGYVAGVYFLYRNQLKSYGEKTMISRLANLAFKQMFENHPVQTPKGIEFKQSHTASNLTKIVTCLQHSFGKKIHVTFLEQNPYKDSVYGKRAKNGAQIMWVIASIGCEEKWLGRMENGSWYPK